MNRFATLVIALLIAALGSVVVAPSAEAVPSCMNAGNVTGLGGAGCSLGGLNFYDFAVSPVGVAANLFLGGFSEVAGSKINLTFQVSHDPSPANLADILLYYTVKTLTGQPGLGGVDLYNPGKNVTIRETVCGSAFDNGVCATGTLADYVVPAGTIASADFSSLASIIYVRKDIQLLQDSFISEFTNSHELAPVPEPATLLLLGSSLAAAGMALRRRTRNKERADVSA
jgi:hypothetical protein